MAMPLKVEVPGPKVWENSRYYSGKELKFDDKVNMLREIIASQDIYVPYQAMIALKAIDILNKMQGHYVVAAPPIPHLAPLVSDEVIKIGQDLAKHYEKDC